MADHDSGYKLLFSHGQMIVELLRGFLRESWVQTLDFSTLERVGGSFVSADLRERHSDMIWRIRWSGADTGWFYVYLLVEFQSTPDPFMAVRILGYVALLLADLIRTGAATTASKLPAVLPLVLYNGKRPWNVPLDLASLFQPAPPGAERLLPQLSYLLIDENRLSAEDLELPANLVASLFRLETCGPEDLSRLTAELANLLPPGDEDDLRRDFAEFELGAVPPLGGGQRHPVVVDERVAGRETVVLEAGSHEESVRISAAELVRATSAEVADICED